MVPTSLELLSFSPFVEGVGGVLNKTFQQGVEGHLSARTLFATFSTKLNVEEYNSALRSSPKRPLPSASDFKEISSFYGEFQLGRRGG